MSAAARNRRKPPPLVRQPLVVGPPLVLPQLPRPHRQANPLVQLVLRAVDQLGQQILPLAHRLAPVVQQALKVLIEQMTKGEKTAARPASS